MIKDLEHANISVIAALSFSDKSADLNAKMKALKVLNPVSLLFEIIHRFINKMIIHEVEPVST